MELKKITDERLIFIDANWKSKREVIENLVEAIGTAGYVDDQEAFLQAVLERESIGETGLERGLAIPHGKSAAVKKATFAVARLKQPLHDWESIDQDNKVNLIFLLAIPESEAGSTHLDVLSALSTRLLDEQFCAGIMAAKNKGELLECLDIEEEKTADGEEAKEYSVMVLAVTACAAGIAHTYMAAEALEKAGAKLGIRVLTEKQGANGIEDAHDKKVIEKAQAVIFATDIAPKNIGRYHGLPYIKTRVAEPLRNAAAMLQRVLDNPDGVVTEESGSDGMSEKSGFWAELGKAVLTGISYMIPVIVSAGIMTGLSKLLAMPYGLAADITKPEYASCGNSYFVVLHFMGLFGDLLFRFMYPVFAAFTAMAIADRPGFTAGLAGGAFAAGLHYSLWGIKTGVPSGFLGALVLAVAAGYVAKFLNNNIKLSKNLLPMKPMLIIPAASILTVFFLNYYVVDVLFGALNAWLRNAIMMAEGGGNLLLASIIATATAFDLGGPVNKAAGAIAIGLAADKIFPLTPRVLAIVIPPIGLGLATILDKYIVRRRVFDDNLRIVGNTSLLLGFLAISEGGIPFMLANPLITIPINIIGAVVGANIAILLGAVQWYPLPAVWGWPLVEGLPAYLLGLLAGVMTVALLNIFVRYYMQKRNEKIRG